VIRVLAGALAVIAAVAWGLALAVYSRLHKLTRVERQQRRQLEELGKLTGGLAHEIKNPLSTVKVNLKLAAEELQALQSGLTETVGSDKTAYRLGRALRKISIVQKETDRLEQILDGFLRYAGRTELQPVQIDLNELVSDMVDFYLPQAHSHSITVRQVLSDQPLLCKVDENMLKQALLNLFINAQQAMGNGGELMVRTARRKKYAVISVSDTGEGIPPDRMPHIFDAYYSSRPCGSGLGLPTAKKIIEAHGGTITATSEPGKGTAFTIKLPLSAK